MYRSTSRQIIIYASQTRQGLRHYPFLFLKKKKKILPTLLG